MLTFTPPPPQAHTEPDPRWLNLKDPKARRDILGGTKTEAAERGTLFYRCFFRTY